jgi:hypothetical protein
MAFSLPRVLLDLVWCNKIVWISHVHPLPKATITMKEVVIMMAISKYKMEIYPYLKYLRRTRNI